MKSLIAYYKLEILVFLFFVLVHIPDLGHDNFNTDVWKWKSRSYDFGTGIFTFDFPKTLQKYHPGVILMWNSALATKFVNVYVEFATNPTAMFDTTVDFIFLLDFAQKFFVVITIGLTLSLIYYVMAKLLDTRLALIGVGLLMLEPFYLALTRVLHLEGLMSTFMIASILWLYYFHLNEHKFFRLMFSALFAACAILTKSSALYLLPFAALSFLLFSKSTIKKKLQAFGIWISAILTFCIIIWPALWATPVDVVNTLYEGIFVVGVDTDHIQYYFGELVENPGWTYYLVVLAVRSSVYLIPGLVGLGLIWRRLNIKDRKFLSYLLLFTLFYMIQLTIPSKKLDRYILPALMSLVLCISFFADYLLTKLKFLPSLKVILLFAPAIATALVLHPDYFSYYNPLTGGLRTGISIIEPKWLIGHREILTFLGGLKAREGLKDADPNMSFEEVISTKAYREVLTVGFPEKYYTQIWPFFREQKTWAVVQDLTPFAEKTAYFVYPVWDDQSVNENRFKLQFYDTIKIRNVPIYNVYKKI